ncbi:MAG TPA: hypothetical protein VLM89_07690 [Phycisphaerae bacterium]|nr:hypothetical protein [Phycisphaerae bacterium]
MMALAAVLALPSAGFGQTPTTPPDGELRTPRSNVKSGSLSTNRPGTWTSQAKATHIERQQKALHDFGGAEYEGPEQYPPSRREVFMTTFFESMFQILKSLVDQLSLALQLAQTAQPAP